MNFENLSEIKSTPTEEAAVAMGLSESSDITPEIAALAEELGVEIPEQKTGIDEYEARLDSLTENPMIKNDQLAQTMIRQYDENGYYVTPSGEKRIDPVKDLEDRLDILVAQPDPGPSSGNMKMDNEGNVAPTFH